MPELITIKNKGTMMKTSEAVSNTLIAKGWQKVEPEAEKEQDKGE